MKESIHIFDRIALSTNALRKRAFLLQVTVALGGWVAAQAELLGGIHPFGISYFCGMPTVFSPAAAFGVFAGSFLRALAGGNFRTLAALFILLSVKVLFAGKKIFTAHPLRLSILCFATELLTLTVSLAYLNTPASILLAEALLAAGGTYFVARGTTALSTRLAGLSPEELASLLLTAGFLLIGLNRLTVGGISVGRILSGLLVLIAARYGGTLSGAVSGIAVGFAGLLCGNDAVFCVSFALAGLLAGIFAPFGKYVQIGGMIAAVATGMLTAGITAPAAAQTVEVLCAAVLFLLLPRGVGAVFGNLFCAMPQIPAQSGLRKSVSLRLERSAGALRDIAATVDRVSGELRRINTPDYSAMIATVENDVCIDCPRHKSCWEIHRTETLDALLEVTKAVKCDEREPAKSLPQAFAQHCPHSAAFVHTVSRRYQEITGRMTAENRTDEVRAILSDQFISLAGLLTDLRFDLEREERFDHASALNIAAALRTVNLRARECSCTVDKFGRMTVHLKLIKSKDTVLNKRQMMKVSALACERDFDVPTVSEVGGNLFVTMSERTALEVQTGIAQVNACGSTLCGDAYRRFYDGAGHYFILLSDGMGTGGRAAVDSTMTAGLTARLLRAGYGFDGALRILNSAMLFKSADESLATVDLVRIDLYTGDTVLFKAGAAQTVIRKGNRTGVAESRSFPIGILQEIGFDKMSVRLHAGDIVLMVSDGVTADGTEWIEKTVREWGDGSPDDLAQTVCDEAKRRQPPGHSDDITVLATVIRRNI